MHKWKWFNLDGCFSRMCMACMIISTYGVSVFTVTLFAHHAAPTPCYRRSATGRTNLKEISRTLDGPFGQMRGHEASSPSPEPLGMWHPLISRAPRWRPMGPRSYSSVVCVFLCSDVSCWHQLKIKCQELSSSRKTT